MKDSYKLSFSGGILELKRLQQYGNYKVMLSINIIVYGWSIIVLIIAFLAVKYLGV